MSRDSFSFWLLTICFSLGAAARCQAQAVDDGGLWTAVFANDDLKFTESTSDRLKWWYDGHLRFLDDADGFNQSIVRPGIGWSVNDQSTLWAGYGWIHTTTTAGDDIDEHRIWQQWTWAKGFENWKCAHRSRLEQRFVETGDDTGLRFRQLFRAQHNLPALSRLTLVGWNEIFYHLNDTDWGAESGFNQNRAFAGIGITLSPQSRWRTEIGYLNQVIEVPGGRDRNHHILSMNFFRSP